MLCEKLEEKMKVRQLLLCCSDSGVASSVLACRRGQALAKGRASAVSPFLSPCWAFCACLSPYSQSRVQERTADDAAVQQAGWL